MEQAAPQAENAASESRQPHDARPIEGGYESWKTAELLWRRPCVAKPTNYEERNAHSPLPAVRDWLIGSKAFERAGLDFVILEFIPHYDEPEGKRVLRQEVLLLGRREEAGDEFLLDRLATYNALAGALQRNDLGLYQHDFITGAEGDHEGTLGEVLISNLSQSSAASGDDEADRAWLSGKRVLLLKSLADSPPRPPEVAERGADPRDEPECRVDEDYRYCWSAHTLSDVGILPDRASIHAIRRRGLIERGDWRGADQRKDCRLILRLAHDLLRDKFEVPEDRATWLAVARLETNNRGAPAEEPDEAGIPRSYRGAVWIYAEGGRSGCSDRQEVFREILRTSLLAGNISVEAQAGDALANGLRRFATRTAAVAIMSRNMSHNVGSHVLSGVVSQKMDVALASDPLVEQRHDLLRYLQERMDFLAEVSTSGAFMATPLSLATILSSFQYQQLLLQHISGLADADGDPIHAGLVLTDDLPQNDLLVLSPGGRNGCHAVYVILENIIRNSAKHSYATEVPDFIKVSVRAEVAGDLVKVLVWDKARSADHRRGAVTNVQHLGSVIADGTMITETGALRSGAWGIREIMIAAAYLRGVPLDQVGTFSEDCPLLAVLRVNDLGEEATSDEPANLGFAFYLQRPQVLCAIDRTLAEAIAEERHAELARQGLTVAASMDVAPVNGRHAAYLAGPPVTAPETGGDWPHRRIPLHPELRELLASGDRQPAELAQEAWRTAARAWRDRLQTRHSFTRLEAVAKRADGNLPGWVADEEAVHKIAFIRHMPEAPDVSLLENHVFWEHWDGPSDQFGLLEHPPAPAAAALREEFIAAALAHIVILDERVQAAVEAHPGFLARGTDEKPSFMLPKRKLLEKRRISVPDSTICPLKGEIGWDELKAYLTGHLPQKADIVVIHLGILERMVPRTGWRDSLRQFLDWAASHEDEIRPEIVICSGRGSNEAQSVDQRFVTASAVERWTVHAPSKFDLYQLLASSRRPRTSEART